MAAQTLIKQRIGFLLKDASKSFDSSATFFGNSLIQSLAANSLGNDLAIGTEAFATVVNGTVTSSSVYMYLDAFIQPSFQATVQANIPALQAAFPAYTIITYGVTVTWGF